MQSIILKPEGVKISSTLESGDETVLLQPDVLLIELENGDYINITNALDVIQKYTRLEEVIA